MRCAKLVVDVIVDTVLAVVDLRQRLIVGEHVVFRGGAIRIGLGEQLAVQVVQVQHRLVAVGFQYALAEGVVPIGCGHALNVLDPLPNGALWTGIRRL